MEQQAVTRVPDQSVIVRGGDGVGRWSLDLEGTRIGFGVKNFWGLATVKGSFTRAVGDVEVGEDGTISAVLDIDAASVDTRQAKRDTHLRSKDFFDVEQFPRMTVRIDRVVLSSADAGVAHGKLTILGETRPVQFDVRITRSPQGWAQVAAALSVDRSSFGMTWRPMKMASLTVAIDANLSFRKVS